MSHLCKVGRNWIQVYNSDGDVRECGWTRDGKIGNLIEHSLPELYHGEAARKIRERLLMQDYSQCYVDDCPFLMTGEVHNIQTELGELPEYPEELHLAFENACNYRCISCTAHEFLKGKSREELEHNYDIIEERIREALPYVKGIGANGMGELFASKRTLKLLSEWKPVAPIEDCFAILETNGSLFDQEHWEQIENLGQYKLHVTITVMSFDEPVYQRLSGVNYPIERIENNLRFVKSLREKEIINFLEIATVVQCENFRTLPEFARRCIEEFGADYVRLRPYDNWGGQNEMEEFFMNVRNPKHPLYAEYKEVMKDPYLQHPKVHDHSGGNNSYGMRTVPYELSDLKWKIMTKILDEPDQIIKTISGRNPVVIYGMGNLTTILVREMKIRKISPLCIIDAYKKSGSFEGIPVYNLQEVEGLEGKEISVIVTPVNNLAAIKKALREHCIQGEIVPIWEMISDEEIAGRLRYINRQ